MIKTEGLIFSFSVIVSHTLLSHSIFIIVARKAWTMNLGLLLQSTFNIYMSTKRLIIETDISVFTLGFFPRIFLILQKSTALNE